MHADKLDILERLNRYILSIDSHDDAAFADNFHDDAVYESPFGTASGRAQILATIHQWHAGGVTAGKRHMMGPWRIDLDGDRATATSSYWVVNAREGTAIVATGEYVDELRKRDGVWKLQKRVQTVDPSFPLSRQAMSEATMTRPSDSKLIVVAGATGKLGRLVVEALLARPGVRVRALVRDPIKPEAAALARPGLELFAFDAAAASPAAFDAAVAGAYAVISTLQGGPEIIVDAQLALLRAAKRAGARRFLPSDYSYNHFTLPEGVNVNSDWRRALGLAAEKETTDSFEVVHLMQGIFADRFVLGFLGLLDAENGVIRYWGDGKTPIDWTTWEDTARFIAAAALDDRAVPARLFVAGDRMDVLTFAAAWERGHGRKPVLERLGSLDDLERETARRLTAEPANVYAWLPLMYARGVFGGQALLGPLANARYPELRAETVAEAIGRDAL